jgi:putative hemolysin
MIMMRSTMRRFPLEASVAYDGELVRAAQRLRYRVFGQELGARLPSAPLGIDEDRFDAYCEHLVVRDVACGEVVGTYRLLSGGAAALAGGFYSETEFHLARIASLPGLVEVGRACIHPDYRHGAVLAFLWSALAKLVEARGFEHVMGCASIPAADAGRGAASLYRRLAREHMSPPPWRVLPRRPLPLDSFPEETEAAIPALLRGYLRMGAFICGPPAWDPDFQSADVLVLLPLKRMRQRYRAHFLRAA